MEFQFPLIRVMHGFTEGSREMEVSGTDLDLHLGLVDGHHPLQGMLGTLTLGFVAHQMHNLLVMRLQEGAGKEDIPRRTMIMHALAGRTACPMRIGCYRDAPLPTADMENGTAMRADGGLRKFSSRLVTVMLSLLQ